MDEEEYLAQLLEQQLVPEAAPPDPLPGVVQDVFFNVDNVTGTVGVGTAEAINARVHIVSNDPFPAVRIIQKGTGDVLLIDNKGLANQNDPPKIPYFNLKNDGKIGIGTTEPISEIHLITDNKGSNIAIGTLPGSRATTDSGMSFSGLASTITSGVFTEVDGLLLSFGANVSQAGITDTSRVGGIVRIDTRRRDEFGVSSDIPGDYNSFSIKGVPIGTDFSGEYNVFTANLDTADINIAPQKGEVYVGAYSSTTSVGIATTAIEEYYRLYVNGNTGIAGTLSLPDYSKITVGVSSDLSIYHDPTNNNSYILENNPLGNLVIAGDNIEFKDTSLTENYAVFTTNGSVELYFDNVKKLETTSDGVFIGSLGFSTTGIISGPSEIVIDPETVGDNTGIVRIKGDLYVDGETTQVSSTVVNIADKNIGIGTTISDIFPDANILLDDAGILIGNGTVQKKFTYFTVTDSLRSTENIDLPLNKVYKIDGSSVLSNNTLGTGVTISYLQKVGILENLQVSTLTETTDLYVSGFGTITNLTAAGLAVTDLNLTGIATIGFASITYAQIGIETVGYSSITYSNVGIETVGYSSITDLNVVGVSTVKNLTVGSTDGTPFGNVGIVTLAAIAPFGQFGTGGFIGSEGQVLVATGITQFNTTGIGLSWSEFSLSAIGGTTGIGVSVLDPLLNTGKHLLTGYPEAELTGGIAIAATVYSGTLGYNNFTKVLSDVNGNFRAIPLSPTPGTTLTSSDVGFHKIIITTGTVTIQNRDFQVGDAITVINRSGSSIQISLGGPGGSNTRLFVVGVPVIGTPPNTAKTLGANGIATIICVSRDAVTFDNEFFISGVS